MPTRPLLNLMILTCLIFTLGSCDGTAGNRETGNSANKKEAVNTRLPGMDCRQLEGSWQYTLRSLSGTERKGRPLTLVCIEGILKGKELIVFDSVENKPIYSDVIGEFSEGKFRLQFKDDFGCKFIIEIAEVFEDKFEGLFASQDCDILHETTLTKGIAVGKRAGKARR